ncbi:unnamed protein product [Dibothriocephalus latus]|uniref:Rho-GAP domain-containing protein n=1 Tax=Dibothriocephalus latus TaxID=60516 RepID=A0A3P7MQS0_DIBLA|nr:unnamed protein product [Dibothriocephalus latus]
MSTVALATVWGPNLISRPNAPFTVEDSKIVCEIAAVLIGRVTDLFFLQQADFHRTLSRVYQDFWAQINPAEEPVPEGHSILYVEGDFDYSLLPRPYCESTPKTVIFRSSSAM